MNDSSGVAYPFRINPDTGGVAWSHGPVKVREDLRILLGTRFGERPMLRDYGSRLHTLVHEPNDNVTADLMRKQAHEALVRWERRVIVTRAALDRRNGDLSLIVNYIHSDQPVAAEMTIPLT